MLQLEESDRIDYKRSATDATHELNRLVSKTPVSPLMTAGNPHRVRLLRDMAAKVKKAKGNCTLYVNFTTKDISISDRLFPGSPLYCYELEFVGGASKRVQHSAAVYTG